MRMSSKMIILATSILFCAVMFYPKYALAGAAVSVTAGGTWNIGTKGASTATTSGTITVKNDASGGTENIKISVCDATSTCGAWLPTTGTPTTNEFTLTTSLTGATKVDHDVLTTLVTGLTNNASQNFTLTFTTPPSGSEQGAHNNIAVKLTATDWTPPACAGWPYAGYCWYNGAQGQSCNTVCGARGCVASDTTTAQETAVCQHWYPSLAGSYNSIDGIKYGIAPAHVQASSCTGNCSEYCLYDQYGDAGLLRDCASSINMYCCTNRQCACTY